MDRAPARDEGRGRDTGTGQANVISLPHCGKDRWLARSDGVNQIAPCMGAAGAVGSLLRSIASSA